MYAVLRVRGEPVAALAILLRGKGSRNHADLFVLVKPRNFQEERYVLLGDALWRTDAPGVSFCIHVFLYGFSRATPENTGEGGTPALLSPLSVKSWEQNDGADEKVSREV